MLQKLDRCISLLAFTTKTYHATLRRKCRCASFSGPFLHYLLEAQGCTNM